MIARSSKKSFPHRIAITFFLLFALSANCYGMSAEEEKGPIQVVKEKYDSLPPYGKFACGAALGFTGSRCAIKTVVGGAKLVGAAFIATEVLHITGVIDGMPDLVGEENAEKVFNAKDTIVNGLENFRLEVRRQLNPQQLRETAKNEREAALGFAGGAFVAMMI